MTITILIAIKEKNCSLQGLRRFSPQLIVTSYSVAQHVTDFLSQAHGVRGEVES